MISVGRFIRTLSFLIFFILRLDEAHLPYDFMAKVSNEIINKVRGVNRVCYDISSKPPATIEWE